MPTPKQLITAATRHQVFLERLKSGHVKDFLARLNGLNRANTDILAALSVDSIDELTQKQLNGLLVEITKQNSKLITDAIDDFTPKLEKIAAYETGWEARAIQASIAGDLTLAVPDAAKAYKAALKQPLSATGQRLPEFMGDWTKAEVKRMNLVVNKAWAEGWTVQDLTRAIRGTKKLDYEDGIIASTRRNAETVARTSIQHVASMARQQTWEENSDVVTGYKYVATLDSRTTQQCRSLDGQVFQVGKGPVPPVHPNCRSTTVAELDPALDFLDEGATRSSEGGYVPANQTYYDWLKEQPAEFQDAAIGPTRGKLFRNGGLTSDEFSKLNLGRNFQPLTLEEMQKLEPMAFKKAGINP